MAAPRKTTKAAARVDPLLKVTEVADRLGVHRDTVCAMFGDGRLTATNIEIVRILDVSLSHVISLPTRSTRGDKPTVLKSLTASARRLVVLATCCGGCRSSRPTQPPFAATGSRAPAVPSTAGIPAGQRPSIGVACDSESQGRSSAAAARTRK
jgi:hypothetical protein